jgi:hypothetical protein
MLFNHVYFSDISAAERDALLYGDFFLKMIDHRNFNPRLIDVLTSADYVSISGMPIRTAVEAVLENPQELWEKPYRAHISDEGRALMLALFFNAGHTGISALERAFERMVGAMRLLFASADFPVKFRAALKELEGSILAIQDRMVSFSNPGVRDFLERAVIEDRFLPAAMNQFDLVASPMRTAFVTGRPPDANFAPWTHVPNIIPLNTGVKTAAKEPLTKAGAGLEEDEAADVRRQADQA